MKYLKGKIELSNGLSMDSAVIIIDTVIDNYESEIKVNRYVEEPTEANPKGIGFQTSGKQRRTAYTAQIFASEDHLNMGMEISHVLNSDGSIMNYIEPTSEQAGAELIDVALDDLQKRYPELNLISMST